MGTTLETHPPDGIPAEEVNASSAPDDTSRAEVEDTLRHIEETLAEENVTEERTYRMVELPPRTIRVLGGIASSGDVQIDDGRPPRVVPFNPRPQTVRVAWNGLAYGRRPAPYAKRQASLRG
jgi:hypothetical protein